MYMCFWFQPLTCWSGCWTWILTRALRQRAHCRTPTSPSTPTRPTSQPANPTTHRSRRETSRSLSGEVRKYPRLCTNLCPVADPSPPPPPPAIKRWPPSVTPCISCFVPPSFLFSLNSLEFEVGGDNSSFREIF